MNFYNKTRFLREMYTCSCIEEKNRKKATLFLLNWVLSTPLLFLNVSGCSKCAISKMREISWMT